MTEGCSTQSTSSQRVGSGTALGTDCSTQVSLFLFVATVWNSVCKFKLITFTFMLRLIEKDRPDSGCCFIIVCVLNINVLASSMFFFQILSAIKVRQQFCSRIYLIFFLILIAECCSDWENTDGSNFLCQIVKMVPSWFLYFV